MRSSAIAAVVSFVLCACGPTAESAKQDEIAANGCPATAGAPWRPLDGVQLQTAAAAAGVDCTQANATITITNPRGAVLYSETYPTAQVMVLAPAQTQQAMEDALVTWIDQSGNILRSTQALPPWPAGADAPSSGEFPFYPEAAFDRAAYTAIRDRDAPMFCYVQGMESMACLAFENGALTKVGVQSFPG